MRAPRSRAFRCAARRESAALVAVECEGQERDWKLYDDRKWFDKRRTERAKGK